MKSNNQLLPPDSQLQNILTKVSNTINELDGIDTLEKEKINSLLQEVDFVAGKYDMEYEKFSEVFTAMSVFDFTKKLETNFVGEDPFVNFISNGLNILNEEFYGTAFHKTILQTLFSATDHKESLLLITDVNGCITLLVNNTSKFQNLNETAYIGQSVHILFENYELIDKAISTGGVKNLEVMFKWDGQTYPSYVSLAISNRLGKIEGVVYIAKFLS